MATNFSIAANVANVFSGLLEIGLGVPFFASFLEQEGRDLDQKWYLSPPKRFFKELKKVSIEERHEFEFFAVDGFSSPGFFLDGRSKCGNILFRSGEDYNGSGGIIGEQRKDGADGEKGVENEVGVFWHRGGDSDGL
ncbi:MAG: hypothetical protein JW795_08650 [Chitinivibrionales bacterium]|nr:hypothetical protein [Chitinivibrionales bacterium]